MKKIMFTGLKSSVSEEDVASSLEKIGPVLKVSIIHDGNPDEPYVIVEMDISDVQAYQLTSRVTDFWHDGHMVNARLLLH